MVRFRELQLPLDPRRAGTIRRVVRVGRTYLCGLCRSRFAAENQALSCVQDCWHEFQQFDPVILRRKGLGVAYRCRYCARDHGTRDGAEHCAKECREVFARRLAAEMEAVGASDEPRPKRVRPKPARPKPAPVVVRPQPIRKKAKPAPSADDPGVAPVNADVTATPVERSLDEVAAPVTTESEAASDAPKKKKKKTTEEGFWRDGARYVCEECSKKYFTKAEVVACYESH